MELNDCAFPLVKGIVCTDNQALVREEEKSYIFC
jgi:hypothetical protein